MTRDRQILQAAQQLFLERGYAAVGVDAIGAAVGVSGPAIYSHFASKGEILATLFDEAMDTMLALAGPVQDSPHAELEHLIRAHARFSLQYRELLAIYMREDRSLPDDARRRFHRRQNAYLGRWMDALAGVHPDRSRAELASMAAALTGQLNAVASWPREALQTADLETLLAEMAFAAASLTPAKR